MNYQNAVFDLDGTLLDTLADLTNSVNHIIGQYGYPPQSRAQVRLSLGNGAANLIARSLPDGRNTPRFEEILQVYTAYYEQHCQILTAPFPGICQMLRQLQENGIRMAVVSNKGDGAVRELTEFYFPGLFHSSVGERDGIKRKPAPDTVLQAIRLLGGTAGQTLYIGDSEVDYETAANAGTACALVTWGFRDRDALKALHPDYLIDRPEQLTEILATTQHRK